MGGSAFTHHSYYQITHKPVYQNNYFPVILLSGYNSPFNGWLRFTHFDLPNYPFIRIIPFNSYSFTPKDFLQNQKEKSFKSSPARLNAKCQFCTLLSRQIEPPSQLPSAYSKRPYSIHRWLKTASSAGINGIKKELSSTTSIIVNKSSRRVGDTPPIPAHLIGQEGSNTGSVSE